MILKSTLIILTACLASWTVQAADKWDISKLDLSKLPPAVEKHGVTYAKDIRPLFEASCFRCHGEQQQKGKLRLDSLESALKGGAHAKAVVSGDSKQSLLVAAVAQLDNEIAMPPKHGPGGPGGPGGDHPPGGPDGLGGFSVPGGPGGHGPPAKAFTAEQVGLIRTWIDQGAN
jgi:Planctomycete cytochrome C